MKDGTDVITNVISHLASHRLFRCSYSNSRDVVASTPSFFRPAIRVPRNACSQAIVNWVTDLIFCVVDQQTLKQMGVWNPVEKNDDYCTTTSNRTVGRKQTLFRDIIR